MALEEISKYADEAVTLEATDLLDVSVDKGAGVFRSEKMTGATLKSEVAASVATLYTANAPITANRQVDFNSKTLSFTGVGGFMAIGAISTGVYKLEIASNASENALRINTNSASNVLTVIDDGSDGLVGIGTTNQTIKFEVVGDASVSSKFGIGINPLVKFHILTTNPVNDPFIFETAANGADGASIFFYKHRGTQATPTATLQNDKLGRLGWQSYGTSQKDVAGIFAQATENHTVTNLGTKIFFDTTADGASVASTKMTLLGNGNLGLGTIVPTELLHVVGNGLFSQRLGVGASPISNTGLFVSSISGDLFGSQILATNLTTNGIGLKVTSTSATNNTGIFASAITTGAGVVAVGMKGESIASNASNNYGGYFIAKNGSSVSYGVYGHITTGAATVSSSSTNAVVGLNQSTNGATNRAGFFTSLASSGKSVGAEFSATGGATNHAILVPPNKGNIGFGTTAPNAVALVDLVSTTQGFKMMVMTAVQGSAITPINGLMLYVATTDATFTQVGFWGRVAGVWTALH